MWHRYCVFRHARAAPVFVHMLALTLNTSIAICVQVCRGPRIALNKDFCLFTADARYLLVASTEPTSQPPVSAPDLRHPSALDHLR